MKSAHRLTIVDMQCSLNCILPEYARHTSMVLHRIRLLKQSMIESHCVTVLLGGGALV